jgi:hypothetical protein
VLRTVEHDRDATLPSFAGEVAESDMSERSSVRIRFSDAGTVVLLLGVLLRLALALLNAESNDDHVSVVRIIAEQDRLPAYGELAQSYHPKLYHVTAAVIWELGPWSSDRSLVVAAQLVSCAAGVLTLLLVRKMLREWELSEQTQFFALGFVALNPKLIGLSAQATNDSFVILFVTLTLITGGAFLKQRTLRSSLPLALSLLGAIYSKGSGLVVLVAVAALILVLVLGREKAAPQLRDALARHGLPVLLVCIALPSIYGTYRTTYEQTGSPFSINVPADPLPSVIERTYRQRPGTISIVDSFLTFRFADLLAHPVISNDATLYPFHRTSLWSQVYGRTAYLHFDQWPPSWMETSPLVLALGRFILVLALFPCILLLIGLVRGTRLLRESLATGHLRDQDLPTLLLILTALGYLGMVVVMALRYRDYATMKAEYVFPALLGFLFLWCRTTDSCLRWLRRRMPKVRALVGSALVLLMLLQVVDVAILIDRLAARS